MISEAKGKFWLLINYNGIASWVFLRCTSTSAPNIFIFLEILGVYN